MTEQAKMGRPSNFTAELADEICARLAEGRTLRDVCRDDDMPSEATVRRWALEDREGFGEQYRQARELGYHAMADEIMEIADDGRNDWLTRNDATILNAENIARSRLRFDARRWLLSKALPKVYGDKVTQEIDHKSSDGSMTPPTVIEIVALKPNDSPRSD